jgi:hypothetical protein
MSKSITDKYKKMVEAWLKRVYKTNDLLEKHGYHCYPIDNGIKVVVYPIDKITDDGHLIKGCYKTMNIRSAEDFLRKKQE